MQILNVISCLLDYPTQELLDARVELIDAVINSEIDSAAKAPIIDFISDRTSGDLMEWQAEYDGLFERGRSLGLWLFEHVHGESRDRGQAMVDLMEQYKQAGLELAQNELPDYIPLFLEFLVTQGRENAEQWLGEVEHILALLMCRLEKRNSNYAVLFSTLLELAHSEVDLDAIRGQINSEKRDDTKQAMDKEWEEEAITFGAQDSASCPTATHRPAESQRKDQYVPVSWTDFDQRAS